MAANKFLLFKVYTKHLWNQILKLYNLATRQDLIEGLEVRQKFVSDDIYISAMF